jgi:hypothetical protein
VQQDEYERTRVIKWVQFIIIIIIYLTANGLSSSGSGYKACT